MKAVDNLNSSGKKKFDHIIPVIDSIIYDSNTKINYDEYIVYCYFIINKEEANYNTSYLDDKEYYLDYTKQCITNKFNVPDISKLRTTFNTDYSDHLYAKVNGQEMLVYLPLNSSVENNKDLIKKSVENSFTTESSKNMNEDLKNFDPLYKDYNNCYLIALCACFDIDYNKAKATGITSRLEDINRVLTRKNCDFTPLVEDKMNLDSFTKHFKRGIYYVIMQPTSGNGSGHAVAVIDGDIFDSENRHPDYNNFYVYGFYKIKNSANYDTSWTDNPNYFKEMALQYTKNKLDLKNQSVKKLSLEQNGSNDITIMADNKKINMSFPLDASKNENEHIIMKAVDHAI